jgi:type IV secretion system protein VirD4
MTYRPEVTPFGGWITDPQGRLKPVQTAPHIGCFAVSGVGKTRRWLSQSAVLWPGPALVSSSKDDIWQLVSSLRYPGRSYLVDLRPVDTGPLAPGLIRCQYDPTRLIERFDDAAYLSKTLLSVSGVALKGGYRAGGNDTSTWDTLAYAPLACLLWAASPQCTDGGIEWALGAAENVAIPRDDDGNAVYNRSGMGWAAATAWTPEILYALRTRRVLEYDRKMRDSVALGITKVLSPWLVTLTRNRDLPFLTIGWLSDNTATVYLLSTDDGETAGQAITLMDHLINVQRQKTARGEDRPRLGLFLDEIANTPLPMLPKYLTESRGLGCNICFCAHASAQLDSVYGTVQGRAIVDVLPAALLLKGAHEQHILASASFWSGKTTRAHNSYGSDGADRSLHRTFENALEPEELIPRSLDQGRLVVRGSPGVMVKLQEWREFVPYLRELRTARQTA